MNGFLNKILPAAASQTVMDPGPEPGSAGTLSGRDFGESAT